MIACTKLAATPKGLNLFFSFHVLSVKNTLFITINNKMCACDEHKYKSKQTTHVCLQSPIRELEYDVTYCPAVSTF